MGQPSQNLLLRFCHLHISFCFIRYSDRSDRFLPIVMINSRIKPRNGLHKPIIFHLSYTSYKRTISLVERSLVRLRLPEREKRIYWRLNGFYLAVKAFWVVTSGVKYNYVISKWLIRRIWMNFCTSAVKIYGTMAPSSIPKFLTCILTDFMIFTLNVTMIAIWINI